MQPATCNMRAWVEVQHFLAYMQACERPWQSNCRGAGEATGTRILLPKKVYTRDGKSPNTRCCVCACWPRGTHHSVKREAGLRRCRCLSSTRLAMAHARRGQVCVTPMIRIVWPADVGFACRVENDTLMVMSSLYSGFNLRLGIATEAML